MPRYRFQWSNIPTSLRAALAVHLKIAESSAEFVTHFGKRPQDTFIQQTWPVLLTTWLTHDHAAATRIAQQLREQSLGDITIQENDIQYLQSCRNTATLRRIVLIEFIALGEVDQNGVHLPGDTAVPPVVQAPQTPQTSPMQPSTTLPPSEQLRQFVWHVLTTNAPAGTVNHDDEGSIIVAAGSTNVFITIHPDPIILRVSAMLVRDVTATPDLYESLNFINHTLQIGRMFAYEGFIVLEECLFPPTINEASILHTVSVLCYLADQYDNRLHETFGGTLMKLAPGGDSIDV